MKRNVVVCAYTIAAVTMMAACDQAPDAVKTLDPSGLSVKTEAITYTESIRDVNWSTTETNPCNLEDVVIQGASHFVMHDGFDSNGGLHHTAIVVSKGIGNGQTSGLVYIINEHFKEMDQVPTNTDGYVFFQLQQLLVNGPKTADDYTKFVLIKTTVNAQGEPTVNVEKSYTKCGA